MAALFQSLLFEAAGRTVNPVNGAVGLLWTGNWHVCQAAVETVLGGGTLRPISELLGGGGGSVEADEASDCTTGMFKLQRDSAPPPPPPHPRGSPNGRSNTRVQKRRRSQEEQGKVMQLADLDLCLTPGFQIKSSDPFLQKRRLGSPSMNSEESVTTTCFERDHEPTLLKLLN